MDWRSMRMEDEVIYGGLVTKELKQIWQVQLELMDALMRICSREGLRCFLGFGSLLGAVRHQGIVPWDDDMDILMPREDFEKLKHMWQTVPSPYFLQSSLSDPGFWHGGIMKFRRDDTAFIEPMEWSQDYHQGIALEIFPLDAYARGQAGLEQAREVGHWQRLIAAKLYSMDIHAYKSGACMAYSAWLGLQCEATAYSLQEMQDRLLESCRAYESKDTGLLTVFSSYVEGDKYLQLAADDFASVVMMDFAGRQLTVPAGYWHVLSCLYGGSALALLPERQRRPHHIAFWSHDESYKIWKKRFNDVLKIPEGKTVVLFGTGNMLNDYERRTMGKHLPAFYVDNNPAKWGTICRGAEVRPPKALLEVPSDKLHLIICNIYYREIGEQLREMGIEEYFIYTETLAGLFREPNYIRQRKPKLPQERQLAPDRIACLPLPGGKVTQRELMAIRLAAQKCSFLIVALEQADADLKALVQAVSGVGRVLVLPRSKLEQAADKYHFEHIYEAETLLVEEGL